MEKLSPSKNAEASGMLPLLVRVINWVMRFVGLPFRMQELDCEAGDSGRYAPTATCEHCGEWRQLNVAVHDPCADLPEQDRETCSEVEMRFHCRACGHTTVLALGAGSCGELSVSNAMLTARVVREANAPHPGDT